MLKSNLKTNLKLETKNNYKSITNNEGLLNNLIALNG